MRNYGFSPKVQGYKNLIEIFKILDDKIQIIDKVLILPDNYQELIGNLQLTLSKVFYTYKNNLFYKARTESQYKEDQEKKRQQELEEQKRKERERQILEEDQQLVEELKREWRGSKWRDKAWIDKNIGEYYTWNPGMEYYWNLIGNNFKYIAGGNIKLEKDVYQEIKKDRRFSMKGSTFLNRAFKKFYRSKYISDETYSKERKIESCGVYGIYVNDELLYVGSTMRDFETRFQEHLDALEGIGQQLYVHTLIKDTDEIKFKPLIDIMQLKTNVLLGRRDIECMELAAIRLLKPRGNLADGEKYEFKFREG